LPAREKISLPPYDLSTGPPQKIWQDYFRQHKLPPRAVAELVLKLHSEKRYDHVIAAIEAALLAGQSQPWMYDVLALTMKLAGRPKAEVDRALMSRLDFTDNDITTTLLSAGYLARFGAKEQALVLYRQAAAIEPTRPEPYVLALRQARDLKDYAAVGWAAAGILQAAWTKDYERLHREAEDAALDAERGLQAAGKTTQADALRDSVARARIVDLLVRVKWTGDGDLDLSVEEPIGTIASCQEPQTKGGGVHVHDGYGPDPRNCYEEYVCAMGYPGVYVLRLRRVDGAIVGNRAQVTVIRNQGAKNESSRTFVLKLNKDQAAVRIYVADGRRRQIAANQKQNLLERLLPFLSPHAPRVIPLAAVPARRAPGVVPAGGVAGGGGAAAGGGAIGGGIPFVGGVTPAVGGLAVGYSPVIEIVPTGSALSVAGVVSQDLRFVTLAVNPNFSQITNVFTFTFLQAP
jgi:hypothetical protein